jgi:hypothetical protein
MFIYSKSDLNLPILSERVLCKSFEEPPHIQYCSLRRELSFIPWAVEHDKQLAITPSSLFRMCSVLDIPVLFIEGVLEVQYWLKPGNGLFLHQTDDGKPSMLGLSSFSRAR